MDLYYQRNSSSPIRYILISIFQIAFLISAKKIQEFRFQEIEETSRFLVFSPQLIFLSANFPTGKFIFPKVFQCHFSYATTTSSNLLSECKSIFDFNKTYTRFRRNEFPDIERKVDFSSPSVRFAWALPARTLMRGFRTVGIPFHQPNLAVSKKREKHFIKVFLHCFFPYSTFEK